MLAQDPPRWALARADEEWGRARDAYLARFVAHQLSYADATGCTEEKRLAAGIWEIFTEWNRNREAVWTAEDDALAAQISALGWALRCMAHRAWHKRPGWDPAFHPQAVGPSARTPMHS